MPFSNSGISKLRRQWITFEMSLRYGRWSVKKTLLGLTLMTVFGFLLFCIYHLTYSVELLPWNPSVDNWCEYEKVPEYMLLPAPDEITVVTMFLDLGVFKKGEEYFSYHSPYKYKRWMRTFGKMVNRVVAYMENDEHIEYFRKIRSCLPESHTKIIKIHRQELPSFNHLAQIQHIYSQPSYPKHYPNTIYPEYSCAMHAKYDVLQRSCVMDFFKTPYFAWVDVGLFRKLDDTDYPLFKLVPPDKFNPERIGFSQAWPQDPAIPPEYILKKKLVWVSGSMVLATKEYMLNFTRDYKMAVKELLDQGLSNTDQEVINAMYSAKMRKPNYIKIKTYMCHQGQLGLYGAESRYFCLGYVCKYAWEKRVPHVKDKLSVNAHSNR
ncbi:hypothetical protein BgiMline_006151 [Biomphalaria glabrata]|uniref:Uncharacterized protein LOC106079624 n=1 Tax=Biomphalaria glabrata TaxID=6526 RepID=A0A9U8EP39_BIOGL|nr:uncharacterized protein LOC106079624 [Biomphalaria glabrata]XP_013096275.2 uncharacterized protein LOC106079624 [Biomphalaria glabrata]XP_013096276.2 uncharacterized protein LOC106079624 [Biomphalaria glabrata]XP_055875284.1 uncharacterized protein LOC106079624 [Biomphalaria glabrata]XP_055875285.1 uncharacterized protein LOC106079624 [Biomphalaria glabrata]XP_055875286.1 uncharacterized protein LOC106079624 [Biomphalaria glabrata]KAI8766441.1 hypothetical protein BgiMline_004111 [Biomphal